MTIDWALQHNSICVSPLRAKTFTLDLILAGSALRKQIPIRNLENSTVLIETTRTFTQDDWRDAFSVLESKLIIGCESELPDSLFSKLFKSYEAGMLEEAVRLAQLLEGNGNEMFPYSAKIIGGDQRNLRMALRALAELKQSKGLVIGTGNRDE